MNQSSTLPWLCPVCQLALHCADGRWFCDNNHSFDLAKSGYVNLLLAHQKASKQPGDNAAMLKARRAFLEAGHFMPVAQAVSDSINLLQRSPEAQPYKLLDIGCGEGYYLRHLASTLRGSWLLAGLDISKDGVQMAAKNDRRSTWVCASSARIPVADCSLDVLLRIFAPSDPAQSLRILKDDGLLITVTPAARHLYEIKQALYECVRLHEKPETPAGFQLMSEREVSFTLSLDRQEHIQALLSMTPFFWRGHGAGREQLLQQSDLSVQVAVWVSCYRKAAGSNYSALTSSFCSS